MFQTHYAKLFARLLGFSLLAIGASNPAWAQQNLTAEQLIDMLQNSAPPISTQENLTAQELLEMQQNSLTLEKRSNQQSINPKRAAPDVIKPAPVRASVDLEILFEYNSAELSADAYPILISLGQALTDQRLSTGAFLIAGHTDAKGSASYNKQLSTRRAEAVKQFLSQSFGIPAHRLVAVGYGEQQLKNPYDPNSGENRRVQIVNLR